MENVFSSCCVYATAGRLMIVKDNWKSYRVRQRHSKTGVIVILPSFLLKSLQFISLFCQGRLQVQIASIMGQLKGAVIRLNRERDMR